MASAGTVRSTAGAPAASTETTARLDVLAWTLDGDELSSSLWDQDAGGLVRTVAEEIDTVAPRDVQVAGRDPAVLEVRTDADREPLAEALTEALDESVDPATLDPSPRGGTVQETATVLERRVGTVLTEADVDVTTADGAITVTADGDVAETLRELATARRFQLLAHAPSDGGPRGTRLFWGDAVQSVEPPTEQRSGRTYVEVTLSELRAGIVADQLRQMGFTGPGVDQCGGDLEVQPDEYCMVAVVDAEDVASFGLRAERASQIEGDSLGGDRTLRLYADSVEDARLLRHSLVAGSLPAPLAVQSIDVSGEQGSESPAEASANESANGSDPATDGGDASNDPLPGPGLGGGLASVLFGSALAAWSRDGDET